MNRKWLGLLAIVFCSGCVAAAAPLVETYKAYSLGKGGVKAAQAMQPIAYEEERAIGGSLAIQVFNRFGGMHTNQRLQRYITTLGQALVAVSDRADIEYHFAVVNAEEPNAFATPGGYVFVSIGLLRLLQNEAQLAGVLSHEIAHITHRHALRTLERNKKLAGFGSLTVGMFGADPDLFDKVIEQAADTLFSHGLDKELEYEADQVGTEYAFRLGYHPEGLESFLKALNARSNQKSVFWSTHPTPQDRLNSLHQQMTQYQSGMSNHRFASEFKQSVQGLL